jgi:hypothetical protein
MNTVSLFFRLGLDHILNPGAVDHLLFLSALTVVFGLKDIKKLIGVVSLFTVAHTTSLALMAYRIISINTHYVEKGIIITIIITALTNLLIKEKTRLQNWHLFYVFFFGMIHGFGFSHAFLMSVSGSKSMLIPLLSFAAGIETGQILFIGVFLLLTRLILVKWFKISEKSLISGTSLFILGYAVSLI